MKRAITLQTEATSFKLATLSAFLVQARRESNRILRIRAQYRNASEFQRAIAPVVKANAGFNIQVICDMARAIWKKPRNCESIEGVTVKFNVPRNCKTFKTKAFDFVELGLYPRRRIAVPIRRNGNWKRFSTLLEKGWICKTYGLTSRLEIIAYLSKEDVLVAGTNVLGVDINAKNLSYSILSPSGRVLKQGYLGQRVWSRKVHLQKRRALLQHLGALKKLKRMRHDQRNYVATNIGQVVKEIVWLAKNYNADVGIENISRFKPKSREFNRKVLSIPFSLFRRILEGRCFDNGIPLNRVDAYHTSKWCTHCGAVGKGHDGNNYALFKCKECAQTVNSDRKASLAVAVKTLLERNDLRGRRTFQALSGRRVPVSGLLRSVSDAPEQAAVPVIALGRGKSTS